MSAHFFIRFTDKVRALCKATVVTEERIAIDEAAVDIFPEDPNLGIVKEGADFLHPAWHKEKEYDYSCFLMHEWCHGQ